jgi:hypothetical protein
LVLAPKLDFRELAQEAFGPHADVTILGDDEAKLIR